MTTSCLHVRTAGDPGRTTLCFLHGFLGSSREWASWLERWADDYYLVAFDLPGHGQTPPITAPDAYTVPGAAQAVVAWLRDNGHAPAQVVGYSMGGRVALYLALRDPGVCRRVVIESASPGLLDERMARARQRHDDRWAQRFEQEPLTQALDDWYRQPVFASLHDHPDVYARMHRQRLDNRPAEIARSMRGMSVSRQQALWKDLPELSRDLLVLAGERDTKYRDVATRMAACSGRIRMAIIPTAGHNVHLEAPDAWANAVRSFLVASATEDAEVLTDA